MYLACGEQEMHTRYWFDNQLGDLGMNMCDTEMALKGIGC